MFIFQLKDIDNIVCNLKKKIHGLLWFQTFGFYFLVHLLHFLSVPKFPTRKLAYLAKYPCNWLKKIWS